MKTILVNGISREKRVAVMDGKKLEQLYVFNSHQQSKVGNIYAARVENAIPGMDAVFVRYGDGRNGFLGKRDLDNYIDEVHRQKPINELIRQGEKVVVQVVRDETEHKGAKLTGLLEIKGRGLVYMPNQAYLSLSRKFTPEERAHWAAIAEAHREGREGILIRTEMRERDEAFFLQELTDCRQAYAAIIEKAAAVKAPALLQKENELLQVVEEEMKRGSGTLYIDDFSLYMTLKGKSDNWEVIHHRNAENIFSILDADTQMERLSKRNVWLDNGGFLVIEEGEAMTTIDVNTGKFKGKQKKTETVQSTNLLAAEEAVRQIRLRNISGMILIDFINTDERGRAAILKTVGNALEKEKKTMKIIGFTELGILQLTRKVEEESLLRSKTVPCPVCNGTGRTESAQAAAFRLERELLGMRNGDYGKVEIAVTEDVLHWFSGENGVYLKKLEADTGMQIVFKTVKKERAAYEIVKTIW